MKRSAAAAAALALAALLSGCSFFLASPFPRYLAQVTLKRPLSEDLPDLQSGHIILKVMNNGAREFLFLVYHPPVENSTLLILNDQLGIVSRYEEDRSTTDNRLGDLLLVQPAGTFVAGTILIDAAGQVFVPYPPLSGYTYYNGFYTGFPASEYRFFNPTISSATSEHLALDLAFGGASPVVGVPFSLTGFFYRAHRIYHDVALDRVALYFQREGSWRIEGVLYQASIFGSYPYNPFLDANPIHFSIDNVDPECVHYTRDGTVVRTMEGNGGPRRLKLIGFNGTVKAEFPDYPHRTVEAYAAAGDHYYFVDLEERILYRANTWW